MKIWISFLITMILLIHNAAAQIAPNCRAIYQTYCDWYGVNNFYVDTGSVTFPGNKRGATAEVKFSLPAYSMRFGSNPGSTQVIQSIAPRTSLPISNSGIPWRLLNNDLEVKITINYPFGTTFASGTGEGNFSSYELWGGAPQSHVVMPGVFFGETYLRQISGTLTFRLRRDVQSGVVSIPEVLAASIHAVWRPYGSPRVRGDMNPTPVARIYLKGSSIPAVPICMINNDKSIEVKFDEIRSDKVTFDGSYYGQNLLINYQCNSNADLLVKTTLIANPSGFSDGFIGTSNADLGIVLKLDNRPIKPMESFSLQLANGRGNRQIYVAPVKNPAKKAIDTGDFTASAILVAALE